MARLVRVGALAPSSRRLATIVTADITAGHAPIIELGPGTGVVTHRLISRGVPVAHLTLIEREPIFINRLRRRFPEAQVLHLDASSMQEAEISAGRRVGAVVSSLPILLMSRTEISGVLAGSFSLLRENGALYQFTYGRSCPFPKDLLNEFGLYAETTGRTLMNFPPATVYRLSRIRDLQTHITKETISQSAEVNNFGAQAVVPAS